MALDYPSADIDALLRSLNSAIASIVEKIENTKQRPSHIIDLTKFEERARNLAKLGYVRAKLQNALDEVSKRELDAEDHHQHETQSIQATIASAENIRRSGTPPNPESGIPWKDKTLTAKIMFPLADKTVARPKPDSPTICTIQLAEGVSLDALIVPETLNDPRKILGCVNSSDLYYIPRWDHFAFRIGEVVFHGNIGHVYPIDSGRSQRTPRLVKECNRRGDCPSLCGGAPCGYYHDPADVQEQHPKASPRDVRNFVATSWIYSPGSAVVNGRYGSRKIGSRETLHEDLKMINGAESRRFNAQVTHDVLCALLLAKYRS